LSTTGIIVGAIAIVSGVGMMIIAVTFPNVVINEIGGGQGSGSLESGTVMILAGVVILGTCVLTKFRRRNEFE
jgi:xanthine/uracil permease